MFGDAQSKYGEDDSTPHIAQLVTYVLDWNEALFYNVLSAPASINFIRTANCVDLSVGPLNVLTALQKTAKITSFSIGPGPNLTNVVTLIAVNSFTPGDMVTFSGLTTASYLNGLTLLVGTASPSQFTVFFVHADVGATGDSGKAQQVQTVLYPKNVSRATSATASRGNWF